MKKEVLRSIAKKIVLLVILIGLNFNVFVLADIISVSLTVAEGGYIGTSYSLVAQGESYESPNYKYWLHDKATNNWSELSGYSTSTSMNWTPSKAGDYRIVVHVRDENSTKEYDDFAYKDITVKGTYSKLSGLTVSEGGHIGTNYSMKAIGESSSSPRFKYWLHDKGSNIWTELSGYSASYEMNWIPKKIGDYRIVVHVRDEFSTSEYEDFMYKDITVKEGYSKITGFNVTEGGYIGTTYNISAQGEASSSPNYKYWLHDKATNNWSELSGYGASTTMNWTPSKAGEYRIVVHVRDIYSTEEYDDFAYKDVTVFNTSMYFNSFYNYTLTEAVETQLNNSVKPKTDKSGQGWVNATKEEIEYYINPNTFSSLLEQESNMGRVNVKSLNVRKDPSTSYSPIGVLNEGDMVQIIGSTDQWFKIETTNLTGWVSKLYIILTSEMKSFDDKVFNKGLLQFAILNQNVGLSSKETLNSELIDKGILEGRGIAYIEAAVKYNVNEYYLMAHSLLETGNGKSYLATGVLVSEVNGVPVEPKVVYNMYGIRAYATTTKTLIQNATEYAYSQGWFTPEQAIIGGAEWISINYINNSNYKQNTLYKMRWNPESKGTHQYAEDIAWANKQTSKLELMYNMSKRFNLKVFFDIPVYK